MSSSSLFNPTRAKVQLKLTVNRLKILQNKKNMLSQQQRKEIARLLEIGKEESARIRVEHIIREDFSCEALEIIELYCELLLARFSLLEQLKNCDPAITEAVNTLIYAAPRSEVKELLLVREQLAAKFGRDFVNSAMENKDDSVNPRIIQKLKVQTPDPYLVNRYLEEIAKTFHVQWTADPDSDNQLIGSMGGEFIDPGNAKTTKPDSQLSPLCSPNNEHSTNDFDLLNELAQPPAAQGKGQRSTEPTTQSKSSPSLPQPQQQQQQQQQHSSVMEVDEAHGEPALPDLDALTRRFEALKKR